MKYISLLLFLFSQSQKRKIMDEEFDYTNYQEKSKAADVNMKKVEEETKIWMETSEEIKAYLSSFKESYSTSFIKDYPIVKARFIRYGNELGDQPEKIEVAYLENASKRIMDIQLKKLFDVMCQWDANLLTMEGMDCSWDFIRWTNDIANCPLITPITKDELALYLKFVNTDDFDERADLDLISYGSYRNEKSEYDGMPEWFSFENTHSGNNKYLLLPMLRTERENFYRRLWRKEEDEKLEKRYESGELKRYVADNRPDISALKYADLERFIIANEDKDVLIAFRKYYAYFTDQLIREDPEEQEDGWLTEQVDGIIHNLTGVKEKIPIEANSDWRQGLIDAYADYRKRKLIEAIPYAYDDYKMMYDLKIKKDNKTKYSDYTDLIEGVRNQILRGRELNGEPRDFNY